MLHTRTSLICVIYCYPCSCPSEVCHFQSFKLHLWQGSVSAILPDTFRKIFALALSFSLSINQVPLEFEPG